MWTMATVTTCTERLGALEAEPLADGRELRHARSYNEKRRGLAGLDALTPAVGLHIHRCRSVHTIGMRFALDLLWLDGEGRIVRVDHAVPARRAKGCRRARSVVEVVAGEADAFAALLGRPTRSGHAWDEKRDLGPSHPSSTRG
jgi:uncharacterized membrane protein (UPF0127 family)